jgi:prolyl 4-hydroxylase
MHDQLQKAAAHDLAGHHDEAINALARGTSAGDLECMAVLGLRLLTGDRAPRLPAEGLSFLSDAADRGAGGAAARMAAITALGLVAPPDWLTARDWLCKAAGKGWPQAQRQLLALCDDRELAARASASPGPLWKQLAAAIDLDAWRRSPPPRILSDDPRVSVFPGLLRREICELLTSFADGRLVPAKVYDAANQQDIVDAHRSNTLATFGFDSVEFVHALLQARMSAACGIPIVHFEAPSVLHYAVGERIANHFDFVDPKSTGDYAGEIARNGQRIITFIVYLNDDYDGGETSFAQLGFEHRGSTGEGIYFVNALADLAPDLRMLHAGCPTTRGEKWIVTQFIRSRPAR